MDQFFANNFWLVPCYPLIGMMLTVFWSPGLIRRTGPRPAGYVNLLTTFLALLHGALAFPAVWQQPAIHLDFTWLQVAGLDLTVPVEITALAVGATSLITGMNFLAQIYAVGYLEMDWGWARFFAFLSMFEGGLCALVLCDSLFFSYLLLEVLTLGTYMLVGLWFNQSLVVTSARDAFLTKRVGDLFLLMGVLAIFPLAGTWNFAELTEWAKTADVNPTIATLAGLALIAGPMGKCAQLPLHLWLDEAMEGPVPSTVLRNSVVVACGAWVMIKMEPILSLSPTVMATTIAVGATTAVCASLISMSQVDIKRSLSYTVSVYMGLIFIAVGTHQLEAALLLILSHALAQGLIVMGTGSVILNTITQDLRQMGGLWSRRPISALTCLVGIAGLVGLPPLGGFWALLKLTDGVWADYPWLVGVILLINLFTAFSMVREFGLIFAGSPTKMTERSPENFWLLTLPMMVLMGFALHLPLILQRLSLLPDWAHFNVQAAGLLMTSSLLGATVAAFLYIGQSVPKPIRLPLAGVQDFFANDLYTPQLYRNSIVFGVAWASRITDWFDRYIVDGVVNLVGLLSLAGGETLKYNNSGQSQIYILTIAVSSIAIAIAFFWQPISQILFS
ncbi:MAG: NAD(P)H-quinone oxidoreductase subunit F [Cyanobacteria bacterium P01_E01_bin.45]